MFSKSRIISTFATFVVIYFFPWIFYEFIAKNFFEKQMINDVSRGNEMILWAVTVGCVIMAYLFSTIYEGWSKDEYSVSNGIRFGVLIGLFFGAGIGLVMYGTEFRMTHTAHIIDALFWVVTYSIAGIMASTVYKR